MSSQTDIEALGAKVRRLEVLFEIQQRESAAEPNNRAIQPAVSTGFSDPALQAENSRLRKEITAKDAIIAKRDRTISVLLESMGCHEGVLAELVRDIHHNREVAAQNDDQSPTALTPKISVIGTEKSGKPVPTLPPKDIIGDSRTGPQTASIGLMPATVPADAPAPAPPETVKPNHSPMLQTLFTGPFIPTGTFPPVTPGGFSFGLQPGQRQAVFNPFKQQQPVHSDKFAKYETQKERADHSEREDRGSEKGSTSKLQMMAACESGAMQVPEKKMSFDPWGISWPKSVIPEKKMSSNPWGASWPKSMNPPTPKPENGDSSLIGTSSLNDKKRLADEEQPGTRAPEKRLRST